VTAFAAGKARPCDAEGTGRRELTEELTDSMEPLGQIQEVDTVNMLAEAGSTTQPIGDGRSNIRRSELQLSAFT
jgi:hypothetical protein